MEHRFLNISRFHEVLILAEYFFYLMVLELDSSLQHRDLLLLLFYPIIQVLDVCIH